MSRLRSLFLVPILLAAPVAAFAQEETADQIIAKVDRVRNPDRTFAMTSTLIEYQSGKPRNKVVLGIHAKEDPATRQFRTLVRYLDPPRDAGKLVLMSGAVMWFYDPASRASVRVPPQQRLIGQASNGDVVAVNLSRDYRGRIVGTGPVQDSERAQRDCWQIDMTAATDSATYSRIEYWVERGTYRPIKGRFYSDSGRMLKVAFYAKFEMQLGAERPTETIIIDAVDSTQVTRMVSSDYRLEEIPDSWFQREFLPRLGKP